MANRSKTAFDKLKYEVASEVGVNLKEGYNGDLTSHDAGRIGGNIVKKVFESYTGKNYSK
jgi:Small, acid-soluble spore proteins, alpha/beta type.